jgi:hypothetical protein
MSCEHQLNNTRNDIWTAQIIRNGINNTPILIGNFIVVNVEAVFLDSLFFYLSAFLNSRKLRLKFPLSK